MSERESFNESLRNLEAWFNKPLKNEQYEQFAKRLKFIPARAMKDIVERIIDDNPPNPGRFPTVARVKEGWEIWKRENPNLVVKHQTVPCSSCDGHGFIWFWKRDEESDRMYEFTARCGSCENWLKDVGYQTSIPRMHVQEIIAKGYRLVTFRPNSGSWPPPKGGVKSLSSKTFRGLPDGKEHYQKVKAQAAEILEHDNN